MLNGELAFNEIDKVLYYGLGADGAGNALSVIPIGGEGQYVGLAGNQTVLGIKTFSGEIHVPLPTVDSQAANKQYVDAQVSQIVGETFTSVFKYKGTLNASTDTLPATPETGDLYRITAEGDFAGTVPFTISTGDHLIYNGIAWDKIDNTDPTLVGTANRITVEKTGANQWTVNLATNYAGDTTITTLGTVTQGVWQGSIIALAYGGTGADLSGMPDGTMFKKSGMAFVAAVAGVDYVKTNLGTIDGGTY
jgi:hypothetical protein